MNLFDPQPYATLPIVAPAEKLSAGRRRTIRQKALIAQGKHPLTRLALLQPPRTCGECVHAQKQNCWWKCEKASTSFCEASDLRVSWPACIMFEDRT